MLEGLQAGGQIVQEGIGIITPVLSGRDTVVGRVLQSPHRRRGRYGANSTHYSGQIPANGVAADTVERPVKLEIYQQRVVLSHALLILRQLPRIRSVLAASRDRSLNLWS